ncbi:myosin heavy chain, striated muscle [Lutzomyia longipalpis]|uniref:myosin heavy chain, striated muscle n=1 Tax=Lutzomyia longipalpis TaxID=7200 RepID=UPI0024833C5A|nr:myosin heavy chain, striated muscle [Lutzomyia longipalpis]XP_055682398.1 myosin heavy chain, striated muscle [Lutzomyia longipalpis]
MHHLYPISKGDQLCPLGFHPQVRWPTRCKRCFRDYKEHGGKRNPEDIIASSPNLSDSFAKPPARVWTSSQNLSTIPSPEPAPPQPTIRRRPASWTSTPDLAEDEQSSSDAKVDVTVNLPRRRHTAAIVEDTSDEVQNVTIKRPPLPPSSAKTAAEIPNDLVILKSDSLAERYRKMQALKQHRSFERESSSRERSLPRKSEEKEKSPSPAAKKDTEQPKRVVEKAPEAQTKPVERRVRQRSIETIEEAPAPERRARVRSTEVQEKKPPTVAKPPAKPAPKVEAPKTESKITNQDIQFLMHVKNNTAQKKQEDAFSTTTDTTDTTLVGASDKSDRNLIEQIESLKKELEVTKTRCERAERDKSDILLRRLASIDTVPNRTAASEALKLQQKVNEMKQELEDLRDDKRSLSLKVKELESDLDARPAKTIEHELKMKLKQAEALCESLMDENEDIKKELKNMEQEIDEMQDNFRDEQADEYSNVKKELEQTTKNCRILSFKLKKSERKIEQLESEKQALQLSGDLPTKIRQLEEELRLAKDVAKKLQSEVDTKKRAPSLGKIGKSTSADGKITRESLTRGGSQEDPSQLQRDLQDSMEREADLREQLKFAEEEAESFRKKASRIEDENESLMMQLKKMASKNRGTKLGSSSRNRSVEKDEGISDEEDPAELRVLLELNEQEASVLRRKVEELETGNDKKDKQIKELEDRLQVAAKSQKNEVTEKPKLPTLLSKTPAGINAANEKKIKSLEEELSTTKKKLQEKTKEVQQLQDTKSKPQDSNDQQSVNLKRQLQVVESEAAILRTKLQTVEQENDKLATENKKLQLQAARGARKDSIPTQVNSTENGEELKKLEQEKDALNKQLKELLDATAESLPTRVAKKYSENLTKFQLKTMIEDLEKEVIQYRAIATKCGADKMDKLETDNSKLSNQLKESQDKLKTANSEIKTLKTKVTNSTKSSDLENKLKASEKENNNLVDRIADLEDKISKQEGQVKQLQATNKLLENQVSQAKDEMKKVQEELEKEKREKTRWESKVADMDADLQTARKNTEKVKANLEKEIASLKSKSSNSDAPSKVATQQLKDKVAELEATVAKDVEKYKDLTGKYELLEEEHVLIKAQLTTEKEKAQSEVAALKKKLAEAKDKDSKNKSETETLNKRLSEAKEKIADLEGRNVKMSAIELERNRLKSSLEETERMFEKLKKENEMNADQVMQLKRENDEARKKLDDFERVHKVERSLNDQNALLEQEIKKLRLKVDTTETSMKAEVASTRLRYEQQVTNLQSELSSMHNQCERFKRDRDTFKQLLEGAQKTIHDLKHSSGRHSRASIHSSGDEDDKSKILALEQQVGCLEDELSESRLECSKLKTELVSEKTNSEIKISEMQSQLNEYEEEKVLGSGRTKIPGTKTRLELSWQKEREELQRLLSETSTLARDLRQTLFEVERERDKERLEMRRKLDQLKRNTEDEMEEGRKKISDLQCDLLELRDAHAKLRTANEKLRRERDRFERERESASKRRLEQDGEKKVGALLQTVDELVKIAPELQIKTSATANATHLAPTPVPRRSKSRSPSPGPSPIQISSVLARLAEASEELRRYQRLCEDDRERDRVRRGGMRRAASTENDESSSRFSSRVSRSSTQNGSLYRKSLSLDQSMQHEQQMIWKQDDDSMSSLQSIDSELGGMVRDSSLDSRLSAGSTQSDLPRGPRKKKRGIMGKLRSLTKTKSVESDASQQGSDSDLSLPGDRERSKKDLKGRLSGMFRRSRGSSMEKSIEDANIPVAVTTIDPHENPEAARKVMVKPPTPLATPSSNRKNKI